jgi:hypothetical protein
LESICIQISDRAISLGIERWKLEEHPSTSSRRSSSNSLGWGCVLLRMDAPGRELAGWRIVVDGCSRHSLLSHVRLGAHIFVTLVGGSRLDGGASHRWEEAVRGNRGALGGGAVTCNDGCT